MRVLGLIQWYRNFVRDASRRMLFLSEKLKKDKKFSWTAEDQRKLLEMLKEIKEETLLRQPNFAEPFDLHTDVSDSCMGVILSQCNNLIRYFSCKWNAKPSQ